MAGVAVVYRRNLVFLRDDVGNLAGLRSTGADGVAIVAIDTLGAGVIGMAENRSEDIS